MTLQKTNSSAGKKAENKKKKREGREIMDPKWGRNKGGREGRRGGLQERGYAADYKAKPAPFPRDSFVYGPLLLLYERSHSLSLTHTVFSISALKLHLIFLLNAGTL